MFTNCWPVIHPVQLPPAFPKLLHSKSVALEAPVQETAAPAVDPVIRTRASAAFALPAREIPPALAPALPWIVEFVIVADDVPAR